jgi:hemerythrin
MNTPVDRPDAFMLHFEPMDSARLAFDSLLRQVQDANDTALPGHWQLMVVQTEAHFSREDAWMQASQHARADIHSLQHRLVLNLMREGLAMVRAGEVDPVREMACELAIWFGKHTRSLDAELAMHLREMPAFVTRR